MADESPRALERRLRTAVRATVRLLGGATQDWNLDLVSSGGGARKRIEWRETQSCEAWQLFSRAVATIQRQGVLGRRQRQRFVAVAVYDDPHVHE